MTVTPNPDDCSSRNRRCAITRFELILIFAVLLASGYLLYPRPMGPCDGGPRTVCRRQMKIIGLALYNSHDAYGMFPPVYTVDDAGNPLHSWRALILPFLGENSLYEKIDFSKPWNHPDNQWVSNCDVNAFRCPGAKLPQGHTIYLGSVGGNRFFQLGKCRKLEEISRDTSEALAVIEVPIDQSVPWMSPADVIGRELLKVNAKSNCAHQGVLTVLTVNGEVRSIPTNQTRETLERSLIVSAE